mmetsp:Transcript_15374/g.46405  ORF Transcript_15374/g.46405 Transcript_15374/m.46405 type:complete len:260 (-) Transcript_15374:4641-5420(-)
MNNTRCSSNDRPRSSSSSSRSSSNSSGSSSNRSSSRLPCWRTLVACSRCWTSVGRRAAPQFPPPCTVCRTPVPCWAETQPTAAAPAGYMTLQPQESSQRWAPQVVQACPPLPAVPAAGAKQTTVGNLVTLTTWNQSVGRIGRRRSRRKTGGLSSASGSGRGHGCTRARSARRLSRRASRSCALSTTSWSPATPCWSDSRPSARRRRGRMLRRPACLRYWAAIRRPKVLQSPMWWWRRPKRRRQQLRQSPVAPQPPRPLR